MLEHATFTTSIATNAVKYRHIFFDLDHTLWDFNTNSSHTLHELYTHFDLYQKGVENLSDFIESYKKINDRYWAYYRNNKVTKEQLRAGRFRDALLLFGIENPQLAIDLDHFYVDRNPYHKTLMPNTFEILDYLTDRGYEIHVISNGFTEIQNIKISNSGLKPYISHVILSEAAGYQKPHPKIFEKALEAAGATKNESIMIGDNWEADIQGAIRFGLEAIYYNIENNPVPEGVKHIQCLTELKLYL